MDSSYAYDSTDDTSFSVKDDSLFLQLLDFNELRISALTKAAAMSSHIKEVTIGPKSPAKTTYVKSPEPSLQERVENVEIKPEINQHSVIMKELTTTIYEASDETFLNLLKRMIDNRTQYFSKQSEEIDRKALEIRNHKLQLLKEFAENDNASVLRDAKICEKNNQIISRQTLENMNRILEEQNKATARFAAVTDSHTKVYICYNDIRNLLLDEPECKGVWEKFKTNVETYLSDMNSIMNTCRTGTISDRVVKEAELLSLNIENVRIKIIEELNLMKQSIQQQKQYEEEVAKQKQLEEKAAKEKKQLEAQLQSSDKKEMPLFYSQKNFDNYESLKSFAQNYEDQYKNLLNDANLKKFRFDCQKAVNTPVNSISSVSRLHMKDKFDKLSKLLKGERIQVQDTYLTASQHPQGLYYCTALLARKIVKQGELLVSSNPEAAFPLAAITVALWVQFSDFGKLLEAYFYKECPYLVPMFLPQKEGQTDKEFYLSRGYKYNDEGVVEKQDKFLKRMSGVFRLHCAIWIAKTPTFINAPNPSGLHCAWQWLASFLNLKPEPDISATLLYEFFTICGAEFFKYYKRQFTKILRLVVMKYLIILQNIDEGGPKTRLEVFLQNVIKENKIPPPNGIISSTLW